MKHLIKPALGALLVFLAFAAAATAHASETAQPENRSIAPIREDQPPTPRIIVLGSVPDERLKSYLRDWISRIEKAGNGLDPQTFGSAYPGTVSLSVEIDGNGKLLNSKVFGSSWNTRLERAAIDLVKASSPFAPLPDEIRRETDLLVIRRTFSFSIDAHLKDDRPTAPIGSERSALHVSDAGTPKLEQCTRLEYPAASVRERESGEVGLLLRLSDTGEVLAARVEKPSGYSRLDRAAQDNLLRCRLAQSFQQGLPTKDGWSTMIVAWKLDE